MASVRIAVILAVLFLLLSHANRLPYAADESIAVDPVARDEPEDAKSTILVSPVDTKETEAAVSQRHRCHHPFHSGVVVSYGNDMIPETRSVELDGGSKKEEETTAVASDVELVKLPEGGGESGVPEEVKHWHNEVPEWKEAAEDYRRRRNKKEHKKNRDKEDSDSDSDDEEEEIKIVKKRPRKMKKKDKKKSGAWLKWFWSFWE